MGHVLKDLDSDRGAQVEYVDTRKVFIAGMGTDLDDSEKFLVRKGVIAEITAMLTDPNAFFAANTARSAYNLGNIVSVLHHGVVVPAKFFRVRSKQVVILVGQHRWAWVHLLGMILRGEVVVDVLRAEIERARAEKGDDVLPAFPMLPAGTKDIEELQHTIDVENFGHQGSILTLSDRYESAMRRVAAAEANGKTPKVDDIGASHGASGNVVKQWMKLRECPPSVIAHVMDGLHISKVMALYPKFKDGTISAQKFAASVKALAESGGTVRTALATASAMTTESEGDATTPTDETPGASGEKPPRKAKGDTVTIAAKPWGARQYKKFVDSFGEADSPIGADAQRIIRTILKLGKEGPTALTRGDLNAVPGLTAYLRATGDLPPAGNDAE